MVRDANVKQAGAEKRLKEAQGKVCHVVAYHHVIIKTSSIPHSGTERLIPNSPPQIDVLQAEVTALKSLVLTSTPSSPNRQLHPQLQSSGARGSHKRGAGHVRNHSVGGAFQTSSGKPEPPTVAFQSVGKEEREVRWRNNFLSPVFPVLSSPFRSTPSHWAFRLSFFLLQPLTPPWPVLPVCHWCVSSFSQPAVPALLSLIICLLPGQPIKVNAGPQWRDQKEGLGTDNKQVSLTLQRHMLSESVIMIVWSFLNASLKA